MLQMQVIKQTALYIGRIAVSAGVGIILADVMRKSGTAVSNEVRMYRAYRKSYKEGKGIVQ